MEELYTEVWKVDWLKEKSFDINADDREIFLTSEVQKQVKK